MESFGQKGNFTTRLEDSRGWPFEPAENSGPFQLSLDTGSYRLISLPSEQDSRRIARLTSVGEGKKITGKGPHPLELNTPVSSTWVEDKDDSPVVFTFNITAPVSANMSITNGFTASLFMEGKDDAVHVWSGKHKRTLPSGSYRLQVKPVKKSNYVPYQVSIGTNDLIPGLSYQISRPKTLRVSVGTASVVEFVSQGTLDASAELLDESAKTVLASNDDSYLDWNFAISRVLKPGRYFLKIQSPEEHFTTTRVFMRSMTDTLMSPLWASGAEEPVSLQCNLNRHIGIFPISLSDTGDIITCALQGKARMGCSIERKNGVQWVPVAQDQGLSPSITIPAVNKTQYRIRVWSDYSANENVTLTYANINSKFLSWKDVSSGFSMKTKRIGENNLVWFKVDLQDKAPGHFSAKGGDQDKINRIAVSTAVDSPFEGESSSWFSSTQQYAWVEVRFENQGKFRLKFEPMTLDNKKPLNIGLPGSRPQVFQTNQDKKSIGLLLVYSDGSYPLAGVLRESGGSPSLDIRDLTIDQGMWSGESRCAAVSFPDDRRKIAIWNSLPVPDGIEPSAELSWKELPLVEAGTQPYGTSSWKVEKPSARVTSFPKGAKYRVRVTIPHGCAAVFTRGDGSRILEYAHDGKKVREYLSDGEKLYLIGLQGEKSFDIAAFAIQSGQLSAPDRVFQSGEHLETRMVKEGSVMLPISAEISRKNLYYRGAINSVSYVDRGGLLKKEIRNGAQVGPGGFLVVDHASGWIKMDLCEGGSFAGVIACKWGASLDLKDVKNISQSSQYKLSDRVNWFSFTIKDTQHVNLSVPFPLAAILLKEDKPVNYQEAWEQFNWDLPLVKGKYRLGIHAINGYSLEGAELAVLFRPVEPITEKNPFRGFIASGESRIMSFEVEQKSSFGIGLRQTKETVNAVLFDTSGRQMAAGKQQFLTLNKGTYYLWLRVPASSEGTECTVYLFGQEPPPNEPPEKLVKWIISGGEGPRPVTDITGNDDDQDQLNARPSWMNQINDENMSDRDDSQENKEEYEGEEGGDEDYGESEESSEDR